MLLTITTTYQPATDLGYLLHKHPDRYQSVDLSMGRAHLFYPESTSERATMALLLDLDPVALVRGRKNSSGRNFALDQYVNDRPYVASSFMSVALAKAFSTAMNGKCSGKPELVEEKLPVQVRLAVVSAPRGGEALIRKLFEPLGYRVDVHRHPLDEQFNHWGESKYYTLDLSHQLRIQELLSHLYVLLPVLDDEKHYFVSQAEIEKLLKKGRVWLSSHPEKELIAKRYLAHKTSLTQRALERLQEDSEAEELEEASENKEEQKRRESLHEQRIALAVEQLKKSGAQSVLDLGCGEGKLLKALLRERQFSRIAGMDVAYESLLRAKDRLKWDRMSPKQRARIDLFQGSLTYRDQRLNGFDAAAVVEVIEHLDEGRLGSFERVVFEFATPKTVVLTTPNAEYNVLYENLKEGSLRHKDHRFEWTRTQFETWAGRVAQQYGYSVTFEGIGERNEQFGHPSQMAIFTYEAANS